MIIKEVQEQLQEDILSIVEGFEVDKGMDKDDYQMLRNTLCNAIISNLNKLNNKIDYTTDI